MRIAGRTQGLFHFMETEVEKKEEKEAKEAPKKITVMGTILEASPTPPQPGDLVEGPVIATGRSRVYVDLPPFGTGIIYGREFLSARDVLRRVALGDTIAAKVVDAENEEGYIELSLKEARQALIWAEAESAVREKRVLELPVKEANKGGLIIEWQGIVGFLPASQLGEKHYPRVPDGDKDRIFDELKKYVGQIFEVVIITADPKEQKLIFAEKDASERSGSSAVDKYQVGDILDGEVTGAVEFGIFVKVDDGLEGLVHISEIDWGLVDDPKSMYAVGEKVKVKVIEVKDGKISLSIKALKDDPWKGAAEKYQKEQEVKGVVIKYNKHGALVSIEEGVAGLVHISEFENPEKLRETLELGKTYDFTITLFEPDERRMTLSHKEA